MINSEAKTVTQNDQDTQKKEMPKICLGKVVTKKIKSERNQQGDLYIDLPNLSSKM